MSVHRRRWLVAALAVSTLAVIAVFILVVTPKARAELTCKPRGPARATLMLLHPGGFVEGRGRDMQRECAAFARHGYLTYSVDYPHRFVPATAALIARAHRLRRAARRAHRLLFAYGLSAGGTYASILAEEGSVDGAFSYAGVYDVGAWAAPNPKLLAALGASRSELDRLSPLRRPLHNPARLLIVHNPSDIVAPYAAAVRTARRSRRFGLRTVRVPANGYAAHIQHPIAPALSFYKAIITERSRRR